MRVVFLGENAQGKTNLLEAIAVLATGSSPFTSHDPELVRWGQDRAIVRSEVRRAGTTTKLDMLIPATGRRAIKLDGAPQRRVADILGIVQCVIFSREDLELVRGAPGGRREFLDWLLIQLQPLYHEELRRYGRALAQRNSILKRIAEGSAGPAILEAWDGPVVRLGADLARRRAEAVARLLPHAARWHSQISAGRETLELVYRPGIPVLAAQGDADDLAGSTGLPDLSAASWAREFERALVAVRRQEVARRQTVVGPHRDDVVVLLDGREARSFASTGQRRTIALALKLAELDLLKETAGEAPLLLLDDVLAELDVARQNHLLAAIGTEVQTFVTTTHLSDFSAEWIEQAEVSIVRAGTIVPATVRELSALVRQGKREPGTPGSP